MPYVARVKLSVVSDYSGGVPLFWSVPLFWRCSDLVQCCGLPSVPRLLVTARPRTVMSSVRSPLRSKLQGRLARHRRTGQGLAMRELRGTCLCRGVEYTVDDD